MTAALHEWWSASRRLRVLRHQVWAVRVALYTYTATNGNPNTYTATTYTYTATNGHPHQGRVLAVSATLRFAGRVTWAWHAEARAVPTLNPKGMGAGTAPKPYTLHPVPCTPPEP